MNISEKSLLLYAVTDRQWLNGRPLSAAVEEALRGGATILQLREKSLSHEDFLAEAREILSIARRWNVPLIINDDVEVALECGAGGVHVGQSDVSLREARLRLGPRAIIGVSAHTVEEAVTAEAGGADYLGVGAVFPTGTKENARPLSFEALKNITSAVKIPCVAIGGISSENLSKLRGSGVRGAAVVSAIFAAGDIEAATQKLVDLARENFSAGRTA